MRRAPCHPRASIRARRPRGCTGPPRRAPPRPCDSWRGSAPAPRRDAGRGYRRRRSAPAANDRCRGCGGAWSAAAGLRCSTSRRSSAFRRVDLPTLGRPTSAAKPLRNSLSGTLSLTLLPYRQGLRARRAHARRPLARRPARRAAALRAPRERRDLAAHPKSMRVRLALHALHDIARQRQTLRLQSSCRRVLASFRVAGSGSAAMRAANSATTARRAASRPPSRKIAPHKASSASARMDLRLKPPVFSSPEPRCSTSPSAMLRLRPRPADSPLTRRERRRLKSPFDACGKAPNRCSAMSRFSTASPRNSSRSLFAPATLRWVRAALNRRASRGA